MKKGIWRDGRGVFELPVQYMVAVVVAAVVIGLMSLAGYHLWKENQTRATRTEVDKIVNQAELMCSTMEEGTVQTMDIEFPSAVKKVGFGSANPANANRYYIVMDWGTNKSYYAEGANFSAAHLNQGIERITLRLNKNGRKYVQIEAAG